MTLSVAALSASPSWGTGDVVYSSFKVGIFDCNGNHVDFSDQKSCLSCTVHCFCFICDYFRVISLGGTCGLSTVCPVLNRITVLRQSYTITVKLLFHFHRRPNRNSTRAPLLLACIIQMLLIFDVLRSSSFSRVRVCSVCLENRWIGTYGPGAQGFVWLGVN